jgi:hypothetical protein
MDDGQISQKGVMVEKERNLLGLKNLNKKEKLKQLATYHTKFLENGYPRNGVEGICDVHL